jgi:O-antigen/teichoic acid export membrane protein
MFIIIKKNNLIKPSKNKILIKNLRKNSKWITLNSLLVQFYDLFDKYLIKFFLGPIALASYSIPQQLTGKLSIISKSFSAYLLPDLSKKHINNQTFEFSLHIFIKVIPIIIFLLIPTYPFVLKFWLGNSYSEIIHDLTKIFSLSIIFSCISHILVTKFEATKTLYRNLKIEFLLMPIFLLGLFYLTIENYTLISISILILFKEISLLFLRLNFLKSEIKFINNYYLFLLYFLIVLFLSFYNEYLYYLSILFLIINFFKNDYK